MQVEFGTRRKALKKEARPFDEDDCDRYAGERLQERIAEIRAEMESVAGARLDACLAVSQGTSRALSMSRGWIADALTDDDESIANLSKITSRCFDTDQIRLLYVRAQVTRIGTYIESNPQSCRVSLWMTLSRAATPLLRPAATRRHAKR